MGKYAPLAEFLKSQGALRIPMTFEEIERVTGTKLPPKAQFQRAWWSNNPSNNVMTKVWLDAGYETEQVDIAARKLVFRRIGGLSEGEGSHSWAVTQHEQRHPLLGMLKDVTILISGVDLTKPADPDWAKNELDWIEDK